MQKIQSFRAGVSATLFASALFLAFTASPALAQIKIAVSGPITGPYAKFGEQLLKGATAAVEEINAAGGINGQKITVVQGDDQCEAKQARGVANRLANDKVHAVVGHFCSSTTIPASEVYDEANILMITPASTNPTVTDRKLPIVMRTCGRDDQQGDVAAEYIAKTLKSKKVAVIHDKDTYGKGLADAMKDKLNKLGSKEVLYEGITRGDKDFNSLVTKMKGLGVDLIYFGGLHAEAGLIVRQSKEQGLKAKFFSGDGIVSEEFPSIAGEGTQGVLMTFGADPRKIPTAKAVVDKFRKTGYEPEAYTLYSYTTVQVIAEALKANKNTRDGNKLASYIKSKSFDTVMGKKEFDSKGDLKVSDYVVYEWRKNGDKFVYEQITGN
ncbi:MAG: branched-chain amino acid ABC transporter substrate-binding protein [Deltaproteobacteria bacterium]|nr:branched-chain amino acid ABC transporter substrate-binding protein [Deltaproteobacteria bacterium]